MGETAAVRGTGVSAAPSGMRLAAAGLHDGGAPGRVGMRSSPTGP